MMNDTDIQFMRKCVKRYYFERFDMIEIPKDIAMREFGYMRPGGGMVRHLQVGSDADLRVLLMQAAPLEVFCSNARYMMPDLPMNEKLLQDAHVIFDIDTKDLNLDCRDSHVVNVCDACGVVNGACDHRGTKQVSLPCAKCVKESKAEVRYVMSILEKDLGIHGNTRVYFSGNEGFHIHMHDDDTDTLSAAERADLADYIAGRGVFAEQYGHGAGTAPRPGENGWRGRYAKLVKKRGAPNMKTDAKTFEGKVEAMIGARIDIGVTMDIHRIFRMAGTLNGKSGLSKKHCENISAFNPYVDAVAIHDEPTLVKADCPLRFKLGGRQFGPYDNDRAEVPAYAAAYMICKGLAHIDTHADHT